MNKNFYILVITALAFVLGYSVNNIAISDTTQKVAVIDISQIASNSSAVKNLKSAQEKKMSEIQKTLDQAKAEIAKETDPAKISTLQEKYRNKVNEQKRAMDTEYNKQMTKIDSDIKAVIIEKSRNLNYDLVLPKNVVFFGGDDITDLISKEIK